MIHSKKISCIFTLSNKNKMKVTHTNFGTGTILSQDENNVTVDFNGTVKTLIIKFAKLTNEDGSEFGVTFVAPSKKIKKQNRANFMTQEEFAQTEAGKMTDKQWIEYREQVVRNSMQSSLR